MIIAETIFIVIICLIFYIFSLDYLNDLIIVSKEIIDEKVKYGWVIISLISFILLMYLIVFFREQMLTLMEFIKYLKETKYKYKDVFRKKIVNKPMLKTLISQGSLPPSEIIEDPYKDISLDMVNSKFLHIEKLPETSFSKYFNNLKTKSTFATQENQTDHKKEIELCETNEEKTENNENEQNYQKAQNMKNAGKLENKEKNEKNEQNEKKE